MKNNLTLFYPQWQGGGADKSTYYGAQELKTLYLKNTSFEKVAVSLCKSDLVQEAHIIGGRVIADQMHRAKTIINRIKPAKIFTVGGGCDADIPALTYLNDLYKGDLTVLWFDAHADIHIPAESSSKLFYGMPLRTLLGEGAPTMISELARPLLPDQLIHLGGRAFDEAEAHYINQRQIRHFSPAALEQAPADVLTQIQKTGHKNLYVHLDLDVLDPLEFPFVPVPEPNGLKIQTLLDLLEALNKTFSMVGFGIYEYRPAGAVLPLMRTLFNLGLNL